jgi:D-sedoheptulose 7-phosphate isomerase
VALGETIPAAALVARVEELLERRTQANRAFFEAEAERLARCCHAMAERFVAGGRLVALGAGPAARSDARHVAVEFVHPVIVGKRALPAIGLAPEGGALAPQIEALAEADDIVIGFGLDQQDGEQTAQALALARARGCLTIAFAGLGAEWEFCSGSSSTSSSSTAASSPATRPSRPTRDHRGSCTRSSPAASTTSGA